MAELDIVNVEISSSSIAKEADEGSWGLILDTIQSGMYSFPIPSFIRETISNGLDAVVERDIAKKILKGAPQEEFYLQRTDDKLLKDSSYDGDYYASEYLSNESRISVRYVEDSPRDVIHIQDEGVGLGGKRLQNSFKIGFSTKRNLKSVVGKFGFGSKAALSTGVDYFIIHTVYNGFRSSFMVFKDDYETITPQHEKGKSEVWDVKMTDGSRHTKTVYWEPVKPGTKNGVTVELEVKKHNKYAYIRAVKNQFQYFSGRVKLITVDSYGEEKTDFLNEKPLYESDKILIPQYSTYTVPHILIDGISYGAIDFPELEIEKMQGKIALKVRATDVDITQSRESIKYTEKTKKAILDLVETAREEATDYVTELLDIEDKDNLFKLNDVYGRLSKDGSTAVASVFSKFLSMHNLKPKFEFELTKSVPNKPKAGEELVFTDVAQHVKSRLNSDLFEFLFYDFHIRELSTELDEGSLKLVSDKVSNFEMLRFKKIVIAKSSSLGPKLANHLLEKYNTESIIYIRPRTNRSKTEIDGPISGSYRVHAVNKYVNTLLESYSTLDLDTYEVVYDETVDVDDLEGAVLSVALTPAQERKLNEEVLYTSFNSTIKQPWRSIDVERKRERTSIKVTKIEHHFRGENLLIVTCNYSKLAHFIEAAQLINPHPEDKLIIYIAQDKVKHFAPHGILITDYFRTINPKTGELMVGEHIRTLNTLKHLQELVDKYSKFSKKYNILKELTTVDWERIDKTYTSSCNNSIQAVLEDGYNIDRGLRDDIFGYLDVLTEFQHVVKTGDKELIATKALQFFNSPDIYTVDAYDEEFISNIRDEFERIDIIAPILDLFSDYSEMSDAKELLKLLIKTKYKENELNH